MVELVESRGDTNEPSSTDRRMLDRVSSVESCLLCI
jgi:hypothetical protein